LGEPLVVERNGAEKTLPLAGAEGFDVFEQREMRISVGDQILATRNDPKLGVSTGDIRRVTGFEGAIAVLDNGAKVDLKKSIHFRQGWTLTGPAAQGAKAIEHFVYMATSESDQFNRRQWTTDITRSRESVWVGTDCPEVVQATIEREATPESALELLQEVRTQKQVIDLHPGKRTTKSNLQQQINHSANLTNRNEQREEMDHGYRY
jgi:hypothetical protein